MRYRQRIGKKIKNKDLADIASNAQIIVDQDNGQRYLVNDDIKMVCVRKGKSSYAIKTVLDKDMYMVGQ